MRTVAEISRTCRITMYGTLCTHAVEASQLDHKWLRENWGEFVFADTPFLMSLLTFTQALWNLPKALLYLYSNPFCSLVFLFSFVFSKKHVCNLVREGGGVLGGFVIHGSSIQNPSLGTWVQKLWLDFHTVSCRPEAHTKERIYFFYIYWSNIPFSTSKT